jgi:opacity protein-like surface antigen
VEELTIRRALATVAALALASSIPAAIAQTSGPGFYIRGDVGDAVERHVTFKDVNPSAPNCDLCGALFPSSMRDSVIFGLGVGTQLSPMFRADMTLDYLPPVKLTGNSTAAAPSTGSANLGSLVGFLNAYFDFPTNIFKFQPYITAGVGFARNHLGTTTGTSALVGPFTLNGATQTNFAWDVGAGFGYPLTPQMTLDLEYKYMNRGEVRDGGMISAGGTAIQLTPSRTDDLYSHVVTIGLRYAF